MLWEVFFLSNRVSWPSCNCWNKFLASVCYANFVGENKAQPPLRVYGRNLVLTLCRRCVVIFVFFNLLVGKGGRIN